MLGEPAADAGSRLLTDQVPSENSCTFGRMLDKLNMCLLFCYLWNRIDFLFYRMAVDEHDKTV